MAVKIPPYLVGSVAVAIRRTRDSLLIRYSIKSAMVTIFNPCFLAKTCRSGIRAMVPSSFMISQITPASIDGDRKCGLKTGGVFRDHHRDAKFIDPLFGQGKADQAPSIFCHKI